MGLDYILIFIIVISLILYKLKSFQIENLKIENFNNYINYNYLKDDKGFKIKLPIKKPITLGFSNNSTYNTISKIINKRYIIEEIKLENNFETLKKINDGEIEFGICQEDILYRALNNKQNKLNNLRGICGLVEDYFLILVNEHAKINSITDFSKGLENINRNYIIGLDLKNSDTDYYFKIIMETYGIKLKEYNFSGENNDINKNELLYVNKDLNSILNLFFSDVIDGVFLFSSIDNIYLRNIVNQKKVKFISTNDKSYSLNTEIDNVLKLLYNKSLDTSLFYDDIVKGELIDLKMSKIVFVTNKNINETVVYDFIKMIYENYLEIKKEMTELKKNKFYSKAYSDDFIPIEMAYLNKFIPYHKGAHKYLTDLGFITTNSNPKCMEFIGKSRCILDDEEINKKDYYWKYNKIGLKEFDLKS
jgi:TRAP-type uncharacterized transport system substrate-binding protein